MANNPQPYQARRDPVSRLIVFDSVGDLPTITFTKTVGKTPMKTFVANVIGNSITHLCHDLDLSGVALNVTLTRAQGPTRGSMGYTHGIHEGRPDKSQMTLMLNIGSMTNARDEGDLIKTLMHEVIHFAQMQHDILMGEVVREGRRTVWQSSFNLTRSYELSRRCQGARSLLQEKPITHQAGDRVETLVKQSPRKNYNGYLMMPHERQAWRGVLGMAHALYPQAIEAARESNRTSVKGCAKYGRMWSTKKAHTTTWEEVPSTRRF